MTNYLITYDLNKLGQGYKVLHEAIKNLGGWWHCLDSTWIVKTNSTAAQVRDVLRLHIDNNDTLLVVALSGEGAWAGFEPDCSDWLKNNL